MGMMTIGELANLLIESGGSDSALVNYRGLSPMWRGTYGPYIVVSGSFQNGGNFEFAIKLENDTIEIDRYRLSGDRYIVD